MFDNIPRADYSGLSNVDFVQNYEVKNTPVIITGVANKWPAFQKWNSKYLVDSCKGFEFRATSATAAGAATFTMEQYVQYAEQTLEEAPLYLFERDFHSIAALQSDYSVPSYFSADAPHKTGLSTLALHHIVSKPFSKPFVPLAYTDLFRLLGEKERPDFRWLVIGPERSGSIFHIDPNQTNAWNGLISGLSMCVFLRI